MKAEFGKLKVVICLLAVLLASAFAPAAEINPALAQGEQPQFQAAPLNPEFLRVLEAPPKIFYGYIPPPMDLSHLDKIPLEGARKATTLPPRFDWRDMHKVTSIKNQNPCGTCWVHGTLAAVESRVLISENVSYTPGDPNYDYSEQNLLCCTDPAWTYLINNRCMGGGWSWLAADTLSKKGTRLESCQPYNTATVDSETCNDGCQTIKMVTGYRMVANQATSPQVITTIKNALYNHGPLAMSYHADEDGSHLYPGGVYYWPNCPEPANHLVCLIGWDDNIAWPGGGGNGAWIVKNSWGTDWGNSGYFYLCYGSANMSEVASLEYKDYDPNESIYYWDEAGLVNTFGCGTTSAWMANIFTASQEGILTHVDFWTTSNNAAYEIYVYLDGNISDGLQSLASSQSGTCQELGYYSIPLGTPVALTNGQPFTVAVKMTTPGYNYPLPVEIRWEQGGNTFANPPIQPGRSFVRCSEGDTWSDLADYQANACLRARVTSGVIPGQPDIAVSPSRFDITQAPGSSQTYTLIISNEGDATLTYSLSDRITGGSGQPGGKLVPPAASPLEYRRSSGAVGSSPPPAAGIEIGYDDGMPEDCFWWSEGYSGGLFAVRFTPPQYPAAVKTARLYFEPFSPDSDHEQFGVELYDDDGAGGAPGTFLGGVAVTAGSWGWLDVDLSGLDITVNSGSFYVAYRQLTEYPDCEGLGADFTSPDGRSWAGYGGEWHPVEWYGYNLDWMIRCVLETGPSNNAPNCPSNPSPANGATGVPPDVVLSWTGGDPDPGDTVTYDVYFGIISPPPLVASNRTATSYDPPGTLSLNTRYHWQIIARDSHGASTAGPEWSFTTLAADCPWLNENPSSGSIPAGQSATVTIVIDTTGLAQGNTYAAEIVVSSNDPDENTVVVPVTLNVGIPCEDNPPVASGLASIMDKLILAYGFKQGEGVGGWTIYNPAWASSHPEWNTLTVLYEQRGYWIRVSQACDLTYGSRVYHLDGGWNLIGWCGC